MFSPQEITQFKRICSSFGISLSEEMIDKFKAYTSLLLEWNQRMHLVSKRDGNPDRILRHFVDSLCIFKAIDIPRNARHLDLGSGAGFPGVPIKIVRRDVHLILVESIRKKTLFLRKLSESLGSKRINVIHGRAEEIGDCPDLKEKFDLVTAKGVGELKDTIRLSIPFLASQGVLASYKGKAVKRETEETHLMAGCRIEKVLRIRIPDMDLLRWVVLARRLA
jgi:16S rRNA (guanine527-N7)-methyltransferase